MNQPLIDAYLDELLSVPMTDADIRPPAAPARESDVVLSLVPDVGSAIDSHPSAERGSDADAPAAGSAAEPSTLASEAAPVTALAPARVFELPASFAPVPPAPTPVREPAPVAKALEPRSGARVIARPGRWLRVCVDGDRYAVELLRVQEVVRTMPIVAMRGADSAVLGVMNLRGRIVPVFDLGLWLGASAVRPDERARIVVVERDDELIGLMVTAVNDVVTLAETHIEPPLSAASPGAIVGVARANDAPTVLLDANWLFD